MIDSVRIENFRCFRSVSAENLGRINLVVGDNAVGKTAFLESLYLVNGNTPENHLKLRAWRSGAATLSLSAGEVADGSLWDDLFPSFRYERDLIIKTEGSQPRGLRVTRRGEVSVPVEGAPVQSPVTFIWDHEGGQTACTPELAQGQLKFPTTAPGPGGAFLYGRVSAEDLSDRLSGLMRERKEDLIVEPIKREWPFIDELKVLTDKEPPEVAVAVHGMPQLMPLSFVSAGINRLFYILASIASFAGGAVYLDEFDYGLYFERLPEVWRILNDASLSNGETQLFLTTHSGEAIAALGSLIDEYEDDLRLVRVKRDHDTGESNVYVSGGRNLAAAIESGVDVR